MPRGPEHGSDGHDPFGLHVFVPGVMGAGIMVSLVVIAADALRAHGLRRSARRPARVVGTKLAADVLRIPPERLCTVRRRPLVYRIIGSAFCAVAGYALVGSFWNFINPSPGQNWVENVAWVFSVSLLAASALGVVGVVALGLSRPRRKISSLGWWFLAHTPLGTPVSDRGGGMQATTPTRPGSGP